MAESWIDGIERQVAANHESRPHEQDQRQRQLRHDQEIAAVVGPPPHPDSDPSLLEGTEQVGSPIAGHGNHAEQESREERHEHGKRQDGSVQGNRVQPGDRCGANLDQKPDAGIGEGHPTDATQQAEDDALGKRGLGQTAPARTESGPNGHLALSAVRPNQQQVRHVGAGDDQHQGDGAQKNPQHLADRADDFILERMHPRSELHIGRVGVGPAAGEGIDGHRDHTAHIRRGLLHRDPLPQPGDALVAESAEGHGETVELAGEVDVRFGKQHAEPARHDADDVDHLAVDSQRGANDTPVASVTALPIAVTEDHAGGRVWVHVIGCERPADHRFDAQQREQAVRHFHARNLLGLVSSRDGECCIVPQGHVLEHPVFITEREIGGLVHVEPVGRETRRAQPHAHQPVGIGVGQRLQQHTVDDAEHRSGSPDAERQCEQRGRGEPRTAA